MSVSFETCASNLDQTARPAAFADATADRGRAGRGGWSTGFLLSERSSFDRLRMSDESKGSGRALS